MATNTLNTRIRLKYDSISNWNSSLFVPLQGEMCIAYIPNGQEIPNNYDVGNPDSSGLSPYAIGIKVGDGVRTFSQLPWIQAIAGDVYAWAKSSTPPPANTISATYNNQTSTVQDAIAGIEQSLGGLVAGNISPADLGAALAQLTEQLSGANGQLFNSNYTIPQDEEEEPEAIPTQIIRSIEQNGLTFTVTGSALTASDIPNIPYTKITGLAFNSAYDATTNKIATMADLSGITGAMHFIGIASGEPIITDGSNSIPTINGTTYSTTLRAGDVILYNNGTSIGKEFVWTGSVWELLGDEGDYAVKGSISNNDIASNANISQSKIAGSTANTTLADDLNNKVDKVSGKQLSTEDYTTTEKTKLASIAANADVNIIEQVQVNGTALTVTNKSVNVEVPILKIKKNANYNNTSTTTDVSPAADKSITLDEIAFNGEVRNLKQTDNTILIFNCGTSTTVIT